MTHSVLKFRGWIKNNLLRKNKRKKGKQKMGLAVVITISSY